MTDEAGKYQNDQWSRKVSEWPMLYKYMVKFSDHACINRVLKVIKL